MRLDWLKPSVKSAEEEADNRLAEMIDIINRKEYSLSDIVGKLISEDKSLADNQYLLLFRVIERIIESDEKYSTYHITSYEYKQIIEHGADFPKVSTVTRMISKFI